MYVSAQLSEDFAGLIAGVYAPRSYAAFSSARVAVDTAQSVLDEADLITAEPEKLCAEVCKAIVTNREEDANIFDEGTHSAFRKRMRQVYRIAPLNHSTDHKTIPVKNLEPIVRGHCPGMELFDATSDGSLGQEEFVFVESWGTEMGRQVKVALTGQIGPDAKVNATFKISLERQPLADFSAAFLLCRPPWRADRYSGAFDWTHFLAEPLAMVSLFRISVR